MGTSRPHLSYPIFAPIGAFDADGTALNYVPKGRLGQPFSVTTDAPIGTCQTEGTALREAS